MGYGAALALLGMGGCHVVFDLTAPPKPDAPAAADAAADAAKPIDAMPDAGFDNSACPMGYVQYGNGPSKYRVTAEIGTFQDHREACHFERPGLTHLATVETYEEGELLSSLLPQFVTRLIVGGYQLPGQPSVKDGWVFVTGEAVNDVLWAQSEPNVAGIAAIGPLNFGYLYTLTASSQYHAICECDGRTDSL